MVAKGNLEHIGKKKGYRLGPAAFRLTNDPSYEQDLVSSACWKKLKFRKQRLKPDGTQIIFDTDYFGNKRMGASNTAGPILILNSSTTKWKV